jgi:hypothetical protein
MTSNPGFVGANSEQLDALAGQFDRVAEALDGIRTTIGGGLDHTYWEGHNADRFRHDWRGRHTPAVTAACAALREAARTLRVNAAQQRGASVASGGSLNTTGGVGQETSDVREVVAGGQSVLWGANLLANGSDLSALRQFNEGPAMRLLGGVAVALDVTQLAAQIHDGDVQFGTVFRTGWDAAGLIPGVGLFTGAVDTGVFIGTQAANFAEEHWHYQEAIVGSIVADRYGGSLDPTEADDMVQRYSGWMGMAHWGSDLLTSEAHSVGNAAKSIWNSVFK